MLTATTAGGAKLEGQIPLGAMLEEQLKAFLEAVKADAGLQEQLNAASDADAVVPIAKAAGFVISAEELKRHRQRFQAVSMRVAANGCGISFAELQRFQKMSWREWLVSFAELGAAGISFAELLEISERFQKLQRKIKMSWWEWLVSTGGVAIGEEKGC